MSNINELQRAVNAMVLVIALLLVTLAVGFFTYYPTVVAKNKTASAIQPTVDSQKNVPAPLLDEEALQGKTIFQNNCAACHALSNEVMVGPGLQGLHERRNEAWLVSWIKNSTKVIKGGDPYALALYQKFNKTQMPSFDFSEADNKAVLKYIREAGK